MPLSGHLRELRNRLLVCLAILLAAVIVGFIQAPWIMEALLEKGRVYGYSFVYLAPQELLMQYASMALLMGVVVTLPAILYELWAFMKPGLASAKTLLLALSMISGLVFFAVGVWFAYKLMLPFMLQFLISLSGGSSVTPSISVENYISFLMTVFLVFGVVFEFPVVSVLLSWLGLIKAQWMRKGRRVVIVVVFVIAALITPPDVVSQIMVAVPMVVLYEFSALLCGIVEKLRKKPGAGGQS